VRGLSNSNHSGTRTQVLVVDDSVHPRASALLARLVEGTGPPQRGASRTGAERLGQSDLSPQQGSAYLRRVICTERHRGRCWAGLCCDWRYSSRCSPPSAPNRAPGAQPRTASRVALIRCGLAGCAGLHSEKLCRGTYYDSSMCTQEPEGSLLNGPNSYRAASLLFLSPGALSGASWSVCAHHGTAPPCSLV